MVLFDTLIKETLEIIGRENVKTLPLDDVLLEDLGNNNMVFSSESAFELGGGNLDSLSFELCTSNEELICKDEILLLGKDLNKIDKDCSFIRLTILNVTEDNKSGNELYERLERIKFTKYRVSPKGYMLRTSVGNKEKVRVSKDTSKYSFSSIGRAYLEAYKMIPFVRSVKIVFISDREDLYELLKPLAKRKDDIKDTIDHILKGMLLNDCGSCSVKDLCDEVEGLREIHNGK